MYTLGSCQTIHYTHHSAAPLYDLSSIFLVPYSEAYQTSQKKAIMIRDVNISYFEGSRDSTKPNKYALFNKKCVDNLNISY